MYTEYQQVCATHSFELMIVIKKLTLFKVSLKQTKLIVPFLDRIEAKIVP